MWCVVEVLLLVHHSTTIYTQWNNDGNSLPCLSFSESTWTSIPDQLSACEVEALQLCMVAFGHGRTRPARRRRVGIPMPALWAVLEVGELLWRNSTVCEITLKNADSSCVRVLGTFFDLTAPSSVCAFAGHDTSIILYTDVPLRIDTATTDSHGVVNVNWTEVLMLRDIEAELAAAANNTREPPRPASSDSGSSNVTAADRADCGILDYDCVAETQQMLPWGSQYRNVFSREGHAWVLASLDSDPQVVAAASAAEDAARQLDARATPSLLAYEVKHSKRSGLCRSCFIVSTASVLLGVLSFFRAVSFPAV